jgi:hypothetical protein
MKMGGDQRLPFDSGYTKTKKKQRKKNDEKTQVVNLVVLALTTIKAFTE